MNILTKQTTWSAVPNAIRQDNAGMITGKGSYSSIRCKCMQEIFEQEETQRKLHEKQMEIEGILKPAAYRTKHSMTTLLPGDNGINPNKRAII